MHGAHRTFAVYMKRLLTRARAGVSGCAVGVQFRGSHGVDAMDVPLASAARLGPRVLGEGIRWGGLDERACRGWVAPGRMAPGMMSAVALGGFPGRRCAPAAPVGPRANSCAVVAPVVRGSGMWEAQAEHARQEFFSWRRLRLHA